MQRIYNILTSILGESKQGGYDSGVNQYQFNCPHCADEKGGVDNKFNLEISFTLGKFHCWSCNSSGSLSKLIRNKGGKQLVEEYFSVINDIKENRYYDLNLFKDNADIFEETYLKLPKTFRKIEISKCKDKALLAYLDKRRITQDIIDFYNTISLMGKHLNKKMEVYDKLYEKSNANIIICLDGDTTINEVKRIYSVLDRGRLRGRIKYIILDTEEIPYKDFGEIYEAEGKNGIIRTMKTAKQFSELELLI